ncbi:hypothetical protein LEP1GSC127_4134 [Leptospira kirschneri str. 200801925]|nr:hypothetical protein LEP1GSC127_4134 [Leptospira kirschneri str. 200801925]
MAIGKYNPKQKLPLDTSFRWSGGSSSSWSRSYSLEDRG